MFQIAIPLNDNILKEKYGFQIIEEKEYKLPESPFILSWKNIKNIDILLKNLEKLSLNQKETTIFTIRMEYHLNLIESHVPG